MGDIIRIDRGAGGIVLPTDDEVTSLATTGPVISARVYQQAGRQRATMGTFESQAPTRARLRLGDGPYARVIAILGLDPAGNWALVVRENGTEVLYANHEQGRVMRVRRPDGPYEGNRGKLLTNPRITDEEWNE